MTETARLVIAVDSTQAKKADDALDKLGRTSSTVEKNVGSLTSAVKGLAGPLAAFLSVREVYRATEAYTGMTNRLRLVTSSAVEMAAAQQAVFRIAQAGQQPLTETAELYQRIATNQVELGLTGAGVARVTETISKSLAVSGTSAASAAGALTQLGQAFASGQLRGEELNSVLENAPALAQALARGMGVTVGQLRSLGAEGKISAQTVVDALLSQSEAMDQSFAKMAPTISGAVTTVSNALTQMVGKMDEAGGTSGQLATSIRDIAKALEDPATIEAAQALGSGVATSLGWIVTAATNTVGTVKWMAEELAVFLGGIGAHDIVRLEEELDRLNEMRQSGPLDRLVFFGRDGLASYYNDEEIDAEIAKIQQAIKNYNDLAETGRKLGESASAGAPKLEQFRTGLGRLGGTAGDAGEKTDKQAKAFQALYDRLYPAEAAQRRYTEEVDRLKTVLKGNELADAIARLNAEMLEPGADATGPADAIEEYRKELERLEDQLDPVGKATEQYKKDVERLKAAMERGERSPERTAVLLAELEKQYKENTRATSDWAKWTEGALDRVDSAFADAWRNIGDGFDSFRDSLTNAFKQMLAELAHMAITRPIVLQLGAMMGVGNGTQGNNGIWGGLLGGGSSSGGGIGGIANQANQVRSLFSMYGTAQSLWPALQGGFANGGFSGALGAVGSSIGSMFGIGSGTAGSLAAGGQISGYTGAAMSQWIAAQTASTAASTTVMSTVASSLSSIMSGLTSMVTNPYTWIAAGVLASGKAYDAGYRADASKMAQAGGSNAILQGAAWTQAGQSKFFEILDKGLTKLSFGLVNDKVAAMISGSSFHQMLWEGVIFGRLFGSGEKYKRTVGSATGGYVDGEYVSTGPSATWFPGSRQFGEEHDATLDDLNEAFNLALGGLFDAFEVDSSIATTARTRLRRTSGAMIGDFITDIDGEITKFYRSYSKNAKIGEAFQQYADDIMGEYLAKSIVKSDLPEYFRQQFEPLANNKTTAEDVANKLADIFGRFESVNSILETVNLTALELTDAGLRASDALIELSGGLDALQASYATYYDQFFTDAEKVENTIASITDVFEAADVELVGSREAYRAMVEDIDVTTEAGREMFATLMALAGQADAYYDILEGRAAQAAANAQFYYEQFTAAGQQTEDVLAGIVAQFEDLELALPGTRDGFIAAVDALDTTTEAGKKMFDTLMGVAGAADAYYDVLEQRASQAVGNAYSLLERSINAEKSALTEAYQREKAEQDALLQARREARAQAANAQANSYRDMAQTASKTASALSSLSSAISAALGELVDDSLAAVEQRRVTAVMHLQQALATGNLSNADQLAEAARTAASVDSGVFGSLEDFRREQGRTANLLAELGDLTEGRQTAAEQQAEALQRAADQAASDAQSMRQSIGSVKTSIDYAYEAELAALDEQLALGKSQIDALNGIDNSVVSVADAVAGLASAIKAAMQQIPGLSTIEVPGFAAGGSFAGGLRLVGERGPELEVTGPSRIYNASQTASMLNSGGAETAAEVRALRQETGELRAYLYQIAKNTGQTASGIRRQNEIGIPEAV